MGSRDWRGREVRLKARQRIGWEEKRREDGMELEDPKVRDLEREWATDGGMSMRWER